MSDKQLQSEANEDETYLKIWLADQDFVKTRWSVTTFFMSISFAILGFSFQSGLKPEHGLAIRIAGVFIYWFAIFIYSRFYDYTMFLRSYLLDMEASKRTTLDIQSRARLSKYPGARGRLSTGVWLVVFGLIYTLGILLLMILKI